MNSENPVQDPFRTIEQQAIESLGRNPNFRQGIEGGIPWGVVMGMLKEALPKTIADRDSVAYNLVPVAMERILGKQDVAWTTERRGEKKTLFITQKS